jgi:hypothetical protein
MEGFRGWGEMGNEIGRKSWNGMIGMEERRLQCFMGKI